MARVADRKHGIAAPATTSTVRSADWDGRDLSGERHEKPETAGLKGAVIDPGQALVIAATLGLIVRED